MKKRCHWAHGGDETYILYHDTEWGVPVHDDNKLFEFIVLESAQAGLSWKTILNRRFGYKKAFADFNPKKVARYTKKDVARLMKDVSIIRNRAKIESTITNAQAFLKIQKEFETFSNYMWKWVGGTCIQNMWKKHTEIPVHTEVAVALAKDLKNRGFKFFGPTICYAHMQAIGMVNDHTTDCFRYREVQKNQSRHSKDSIGYNSTHRT